jgi:hypothetical protein
MRGKVAKALRVISDSREQYRKFKRAYHRTPTMFPTGFVAEVWRNKKLDLAESNRKN